MPRVFQSHHDEEPERLTAAAARSSEDAARLRADLATSQELAFPMDRATPPRNDTSVGVSANSILAQSSGSSSSDAAAATLTADAQQPLRTSYFTKLASQLLNRESVGSEQSSGYGSAPSGQFNDSLIRSPEFDKISLDSAPIIAAAKSSTDTNSNMTNAATSTAVSSSEMDASVGPSVSAYNPRKNESAKAARPSGRARLSSDLSSVQREMENNAYASSVSESTYMNMRKTLDPEALLNGDVRNAGTSAVLSSLRPVTNPFDLTLDPNMPGPDFQRRRAATTTAITRQPTIGRVTSFELPDTNRSQRSWTVAGQVPPPAPVILAHDPRGTFRTTNRDTAQQIFASQQVRLQNKWQTDMWIYMKNSHPFLSVCTAHRWHPYKKQDRLLVVVVALLLAIFLCGLYATQDCCKTVADTSIAVISNSQRHLLDELVEEEESSFEQRHRVLAEDVNCQPFGASCDASKNLCSLGATCKDSKCVPTEASANTTACSANAQCPTGWRCSPSRGKCRPSLGLVCYLPVGSTNGHTSRGVSFAAEDGENTPTPAAGGSNGSGGESAPVDAISAIATLIQYAKDNNITLNGTTAVIPSPNPTLSATPTPSQTTKTPTPTTPAPSANWNFSSGSGVNKDDAILDPSALNATIEKFMITLTKPTNGGVYTVSSKIPIAWEVKILEGDRVFVNTLKFRVDFSRDGQVFDTVVSDIESDSILAESPIKYHYDWDLAKNNTLACTSCVLRVCTQQQDSAVDPVCIRTDGASISASVTSSSTAGLLTTTPASQPKITFRIVREILECECGVKYSSFVTYSYLLALVFPLAFVLFEQFVTFYQDSKVLGMFARRGGPKMPVIGCYAAEATKRGRLVLVVVAVALIFACGMVLARITSANFMGSKGDVAVLWVVMFLLVLVIGFIYSSATYYLIFTVRWYRDEKTMNDGFAAYTDFALMLGENANHTVLQAQPPHGQPLNHPAGLSYQWPQDHGTNSSRSGYSTAIVSQRSGMAVV